MNTVQLHPTWTYIYPCSCTEGKVHLCEVQIKFIFSYPKGGTRDWILEKSHHMRDNSKFYVIQKFSSNILLNYKVLVRNYK